MTKAEEASQQGQVRAERDTRGGERYYTLLYTCILRIHYRYCIRVTGTRTRARTLTLTC